MRTQGATVFNKHGGDCRSTDPETGVAPGMTRSRNMRSRYRCSMCPAIHINSRSWLRSSSTHEPSDPPLRVIFHFWLSFTASQTGMENGEQRRHYSPGRLPPRRPPGSAGGMGRRGTRQFIKPRRKRGGGEAVLPPTLMLSPVPEREPGQVPGTGQQIGGCLENERPQSHWGRRRLSVVRS